MLLKFAATMTSSPSQLTMRGLTGAFAVTVAPAAPDQQPLVGYSAFEASVTFATDPGSCTFWESNPTLQGVMYGSGGTTYYTFAGSTPTELALPLSFLAAVDSTQPVVISNEAVPGSPPTTAGLTLAYPFSLGPVSGFGQVSLDFASCGFSVGGTAIMQLGAVGPAGAALASELSGPQGLQIQVGSLFGSSGELPPNVVIARALYQAEQVSANLAIAAQNQQEIIELRSQVAATAAGQLAQAKGQLATVQAPVTAAQAALADAESHAYLESFAAMYGDDALTLEAAEENLFAVANAVTAASTNLDEVQAVMAAPIAREQANVDALTEISNVATAAETEARTQADDLAAQSAQTAHPKILQLTLDITYCTTCQATFSLSVDGQLNFAGPWVLELGLTYQNGAAGSTAEVEIGGGIEEQLQVSADVFGASVNAELTLSINFGIGFDPLRLTDVSATASLSAAVDVWASVWCCTWNAQLASVTGQASIQVDPTPAQYSLDLELQVGPFSWDPRYGPAQF